MKLRLAARAGLALAFASSLGGAAVESIPPAAAQTVEGDLRIVRTIRESVFQVAWSPDGRHVAGLLSEGYAVWEARSGRKVAELHNGYGAFTQRDFAFSPDGKHVLVQPDLVQSRGVLKEINGQKVVLALWNFQNRKIEGEILGPGPILDYFLSGNGALLVAVFDRRVVVVYETRTWAPINRFQLPVSANLAIHHSAEYMVVGAGGRYEFRALPSGELISEITGFVGDRYVGPLPAGDITFLGTSDRFVVTSERSGAPNLPPFEEALRILHAPTGTQVASFTVPDLTITRSLSVSADGRILGLSAEGNERYGGGPSTYRVWDTITAREIGFLRGSGTYFNDAKVSRDGRFAAVVQSRLGGSGPTNILMVEILR